jgi:methylated-DNA-[protein]-cysteine S-methyltransferase
MPDIQNLFIDSVPTPIGAMLLVTDAAGSLRALNFEDHAYRMQRWLRLHYGSCTPTTRIAPRELKVRLRRYFEGDLASLHAIAWSTAGTDFQHIVWRALTKITPGATTTYGALARALGNPAASRAVGLANGANPISLVVPCHRVIGADGALTGYGGGLHRKRWLLEHEGVCF